MKNNTRTCSGKSAIRISSGNALWFFFLQARSHKESEIINTDAVSSEKWKYIFLFSGLFRWARMVCGGFICTKNALCALNIVYVVSRNLLLLYGLYGNVTERWRRGGRRRGRRRTALKRCLLLRLILLLFEDILVNLFKTEGDQNVFWPVSLLCLQQQVLLVIDYWAQFMGCNCFRWCYCSNYGRDKNKCLMIGLGKY